MIPGDSWGDYDYDNDDDDDDERGAYRHGVRNGKGANKRDQREAEMEELKRRLAKAEREAKSKNRKPVKPQVAAGGDGDEEGSSSGTTSSDESSVDPSSDGSVTTMDESSSPSSSESEEVGKGKGPTRGQGRLERVMMKSVSYLAREQALAARKKKEDKKKRDRQHAPLKDFLRNGDAHFLSAKEWMGKAKNISATVRVRRQAFDQHKKATEAMDTVDVMDPEDVKNQKKKLKHACAGYNDIRHVEDAMKDEVLRPFIDRIRTTIGPQVGDFQARDRLIIKFTDTFNLLVEAMATCKPGRWNASCSEAAAFEEVYLGMVTWHSAAATNMNPMKAVAAVTEEWKKGKEKDDTKKEAMTPMQRRVMETGQEWIKPRPKASGTETGRAVSKQ